MSLQTTEPFYWLDIPAKVRKNWWKLSEDNKRRLSDYYKKVWYLIQESGDE